MIEVILFQPPPLGTINPPAPILAFGGTEAGLSIFIQTIISLLIIIAGIASFVMIIIAGIQWSTSGGEPKAVEAARGRATAAIIGLVLTLASLAIIRVLEFFFHINIISLGISLPGP